MREERLNRMWSRDKAVRFLRPESDERDEDDDEDISEEDPDDYIEDDDSKEKSEENDASDINNQVQIANNARTLSHNF